jgi:hypothetical protein
MHASHAYVNNAGNSDEDLRLLNTLLSTGASEGERNAPTVSRPGGFKNDPDDPTNPNEVRERHLNKIKR